jgi:long-chain acyl-CoA synthetase
MGSAQPKKAPMNVLTSLLKNNAQLYPHYPALTIRLGYRAISLSYQDVFIYAQKVAVFLEKQGVKKGDVVVICAPNSPYWVCLAWGCWLIGAVIVPLNVQITQDIILKILEQTKATIIFTHILFKQTIPSLVHHYSIEYLADLIRDVDISTYKEITLHEDDMVEIMYTSGTTGDPKGVILTHKNLLSNVEALKQILPFEHTKDRLLSILPLSHIFEQTAGLLVPFYYADHIIYAHSHTAIGTLLKEYKITKMIAVPEFLHLMLNRFETAIEEKGKGKMYNLLIRMAKKFKSKRISRLLFYKLHSSLGGSLEFIASGGAPLDPAIEERWKILGIDILQGYGLTETSPVISSNTGTERKIGSVGKALQGVTIKLTHTGEILVKGDNVFQGYYKNSVQTTRAFTRDGWFKTGDIGYIDQDGFLFLKGRSKYMILSSGGQNVFPEDIERELNKEALIQDSCVIGVKKGHESEMIHAVILLTDPLPADRIAQLITSVNDRLPSYQRINGWSLWEEGDFPRTPTKKIKKEKIIAHVQYSLANTSKPVAQTSTSYLIKILATITDIEIQNINPETKIIQELGLDSLMRVELVRYIEEHYHVIVEENIISSTTTVAQLEEQIIALKKQAAKPQKHLKKWPRSKVVSFLRPLAQKLLFVFCKFFIKLKVTGLENLDDIHQPILFMPNHLSYADSIVINMALPPQWRKVLSYAAAEDFLFDEIKQLVPLAHFLFNAFPLPRTESGNIRHGLENIGTMLDKGFSVVLFPEGRVSETGTLLPLKRGAGLIATQMDTYVVPVRIHGINIIFPFGTMVPRKRHEVHVTIGKPLRFNRFDSYLTATDEIQNALENL